MKRAVSKSYLVFGFFVIAIIASLFVLAEVMNDTAANATASTGDTALPAQALAVVQALAMPERPCSALMSRMLASP